MASHATEAARRACGAAVALAFAGAAPGYAAVSIGHLSDIAFGTIGDLVTDAVQSESVCAYAGPTGGRYSVTATGDGAGGAFTLAAGGGQTLAYQVQWAAAPGQASGTQLVAGTALTGQTAVLLDCSLGAQNNASLIVVLRAGALGDAAAGSYSGALQIMLAPD